MGELTEAQVCDIWDDATNSVCQTMQDLNMCKCPDGGCIAAQVRPQNADLTYHTGLDERQRAALEHSAASRPLPDRSKEERG